jgi:hypothetical protein
MARTCGSGSPTPRVIEGTAGWYVFDDGGHLDLGALKTNKRDQNYGIPAGRKLDDYRSVSIWCARFAVSFCRCRANCLSSIAERTLKSRLNLRTLDLPYVT